MDGIQKRTSPGKTTRAKKLSHSSSCMINAEDRVDLLENVLGSDLDINLLYVWSQTDGVKREGWYSLCKARTSDIDFWRFLANDDGFFKASAQSTTVELQRIDDQYKSLSHSNPLLKSIHLMFSILDHCMLLPIPAFFHNLFIYRPPPSSPHFLRCPFNLIQ